MAGALIKVYGSVENARDEALQRSPELQELWKTQYTLAWWPRISDFWEAFWKQALEVLGIVDAVPTAADHAGASDAGVQRDALSKGKRPTEPFLRKDFQMAQRMLDEGKDKREIARTTGISRQRVDRIEKYWQDPGRDYEQQSGPIPGTVMLRRV